MTRPDVEVMRDLLAERVETHLASCLEVDRAGDGGRLLLGLSAAECRAILTALRSTGAGRSEAEGEMRRHWADFCDADPTPDGFVERMEAAGLVEIRGVNRDDLEDPFAAEIQSAFGRLAKERHPDRPGGSHDMMAELNRARSEGLKEAEGG